MQRTLAGVRGSIRTVTSDFDRLQGSITGTIGRISNLYGMLAGGALYMALTGDLFARQRKWKPI